MTKSYEIDFKLYGDDMQFVEIELDPNESVLAEAGAMIYMDKKIKMETIFGDDKGKGFMSKFLGVGKRLLTGEGLFMTVFSNISSSKAYVSFAALYPGKIIPVDLSKLNGIIICQKDAFLCAAKGVSVSLYLQKKIKTDFFGEEGFIMEKLEGSGIAFLHAGGTIIKKSLKHGDELRIDTGCLIAMSENIDFDIEFERDVKSALFGKEGLFIGILRGEGDVWLQSLPFSRMADRIFSATRNKKDESSNINNQLRELSGLANLFGND